MGSYALNFVINLMTDKIQLMTRMLMTTILFTGGVVPHTFATYDDDHDDDACECEEASSLTVQYDGPDDVYVEVYKQPRNIDGIGKDKFNKPPVHIFQEVDNTGVNTGGSAGINSGDLLTVTAYDVSKDKDEPREELYKKTVFRVIDKSSSDQIGVIVIHTDCDDDDRERNGFLYKDRVYEVNEINPATHITLTIEEVLDDDGVSSIPDNAMCEASDGDDVPICHGTLLDLEGLDHGYPLSMINDPFGQLAVAGVTLVAPPGESGPFDTFIVFNTDESGTQDPDLQVDQGNIIITPENNQQNSEGIFTNPDDATTGAKQIYNFAVPTDIQFFMWVDQDSSQETVNAIAWDAVDGSVGAGTKIAELPGMTISPPVGDGEFEYIELDGFLNARSLEFDYDGSGGVGKICIKDSELPATLKVTKIINSEDPENDPGLFNLLIDGVPVVTDVGHNGMGQIETNAGLHTVSETAGTGTSSDDYTVSFSAPCDPVTGQVTLTPGQNAECQIINTPVAPPMGTLTLKKAVTSDNTSDLDSLTPDDFKLFIKSVEPGSSPIEITELKQEVIPGTYTIHETMPVPGEGDPVYSFVLIAGDTACPAMLEIDDTVDPLDTSDEFTIEANQDITCTIYNDDEGDGTSGGGVFFHRLNIPFNIGGPDAGDHTCATAFGSDPADAEIPCIQRNNFGNTFRVHDFGLGSITAALALTITPVSGGPSECLFNGIRDANTFEFSCTSPIPGEYSANYALFNTPTIGTVPDVPPPSP